MRILLLEDEPEMARALLEALRRHEVLVDHVSTIADADALARDGNYDVLVLTVVCLTERGSIWSQRCARVSSPYPFLF